MSNSAQSVSPAPQATKKNPLPNIEQLKETFARDGYLVFRNLVSPERLAALHKQLSQAFDSAKQSGQLFSGGGTISGHLNCFPGESSRFAYEALESNGIVDLIKMVFPKATRLPNVGCNFNLPHSVAQHYHADRIYLDHFMIALASLVLTPIAIIVSLIVPSAACFSIQPLSLM